MVRFGILALTLALVAGSAVSAEHVATEGGAAGGQTNTPVHNTGMSKDDQWACEVAMCMSNPAGPTAVAECVAPIKKLHKQLAKGKPFPKCKFLAGGGSSGGGTGGGTGGGGEDRPAQQVQ